MTLDVSVTDDLAACHAIRRAVFIDGQDVPEALEVDGLDGEATHLLARREGVPIGTLRILRDGDAGKVGRVAVLESERGQGTGAALMRAAERECRLMGLARVTLGSQVHAIPFYERLGYAAHGPVYDDAGIPHRDMTLPLEP